MSGSLPPQPPVALRAALDHLRHGRLEEAEAALRRVLQRAPREPEANHLLGMVLFDLKRHEQALYFLERAVAAQPARAQFRSNLGNLLSAMGRTSEATGAYREAIRLAPDYAPALIGLSQALMAVPEYDGGAAAAREAVRLAPERAAGHLNLAGALLESGRVGEAVGVLREAACRFPADASVRSALLPALLYWHDSDQGDVAREHAHYGAVADRAGGPPRPMARAAFTNSRDPERRLRLAYLSPDLRAHAVASFVEPLLAHHHREGFEVRCYSTSPIADATTARLQGHLREENGRDAWIAVAHLSGAALVERLRADAVDILVELSGHSIGNRLAALARRAAPVQATYLGYPSITGVRAIDYRLVDATTDPEEEGAGAEGEPAERLIRLPGCFLAYQPPVGAPGVAPISPGAQFGAVTFGSFNALPKIGAPVVEAWSAVLRGVPGSRLLIKNRSLADAGSRARLLDAFAARGVGAERVELLGEIASFADHLGLYARVDVGLDPFPYNGTTTTCEALWMGVPVVALRGRAHAGRVGASLLAAVGLPDLAAGSVEEYVGLAVELGRDTDRLSGLRQGLRERMAASPLCDGPGLTRRVEVAYRAMWREWCSEP